MWEWYQVYCDEPWGEQRADWRMAARLSAPWNQDIRLWWPYVEPTMTADQYRDAKAALEARIQENRRGNRRESKD